jgi:membrane associated rhomboid family serine protease
MTHRPATILFAALMLLGFVYQLRLAALCCSAYLLPALQATTFEEVLLDSGGAVTTMSLRTDWWRLATSMFVHAGIIHLLVNLLTLLQIGDLLESLFGTPAVLISFVVGGLCAAVATLLLANPESPIVYVGASGGIFSLAGTLLVASRRIWRAERSTWSRRLSSRLIGCLSANLVLGVVVSAVAASAGLGFAIANTAHVGGLAAGMLVGLLPFRMLVNERTANIIRWFDPPPPEEDPTGGDQA